MPCRVGLVVVGWARPPCPLAPRRDAPAPSVARVRPYAGGGAAPGGVPALVGVCVWRCPCGRIGLLAAVQVTAAMNTEKG